MKLPLNFLNRELEIYSKNQEFLADMQRLPSVELLRWLIFSFKVTIGQGRKLPKKLAVSGSVNVNRSIAQVSSHFDKSLNLFGNTRDASYVRSFYVILLKRLLPLTKNFLNYRYFNSLYYKDVVFDLFSIMYSSWMEALEFNGFDELELVIFGNDFIFYNRAMIAAISGSRKLKGQGPNLGYIQHGEIGQNFPPLTHFDTVWLFNEFSFERYSDHQSFVGEKVYLRKRDSLPAFSIKKIEKVLVCVNHYDELDNLEIVANKFLKEFEVRFRLHSYVKKKVFLERFPNFDGKLVEDIYLRPIDKALEDADLWLAGNSSVLLDALSQGVRCLYVHLGGSYDYYGFVEGMILPKLSLRTEKSLEEIVLAFDYEKSFRELYW